MVRVFPSRQEPLPDRACKAGRVINSPVAGGQGEPLLRIASSIFIAAAIGRSARLFGRSFLFLFRQRTPLGFYMVEFLVVQVLGDHRRIRILVVVKQADGG
jgi:hypothetical protein